MRGSCLHYAPAGTEEVLGEPSTRHRPPLLTTCRWIARLRSVLVWNQPLSLENPVHDVQPGDTVYIKNWNEEPLKERWARSYRVLLTTFTAIKDQSHTKVSQYRQDHSLIMRSIVHMTDAAHSGIMPPSQLTTINQSQRRTQLGLNLGGTNLPHTSPSPPASKSATPSQSSSINEEDADESNRATGEKRAAPDSGKKPKTPKKKKKKDPNEPQKPVSAYALFFRDTQAAIKGQNPNATFGEVSKIVASMWDSSGEQKQIYKRKTEAAKKEYRKALAAYRTSLVSKAAEESAEAQTIRSVQQTLASTNLSSSLILNTSLSQRATVLASPQSLQQSLSRVIAPKPLTIGLPMIVASVNIAPNMPTNIAALLLSSMGTNMVATPSSSLSWFQLGQSYFSS
ncbi:TOX high mobility group box family member 3-like [Oxyura jamaicensis]|uniref:TOX high mobility group box family member 3-like n=1 Tax=Oxyura jamaicensis TaxID=8884 RepID=UPI0015A5CBAF|nr:TOX high mobility group box family member 3-like [Oxyura jamaicensis]